MDRDDARQAVKCRIDREAHALYLRLDDSTIVESEDVAPGVVLDFDEHEQVVGIELLQISQRTSELSLDHLEFERV